MVILIFQRDLCPPPSFPLCPVGCSTAAKILSLLSGILLVVVLFLLAMDSTASPSFPPQLGKQEPQVSFFSGQGACPQKPTRGTFFFFFFKLLVLSILFPQLEQNYCFLMVEYQKDTEGLAMKQGGT